MRQMVKGLGQASFTDCLGSMCVDIARARPNRPQGRIKGGCGDLFARICFTGAEMLLPDRTSRHLLCCTASRLQDVPLYLYHRLSPDAPRLGLHDFATVIPSCVTPARAGGPVAIGTWPWQSHVAGGIYAPGQNAMSVSDGARGAWQWRDPQHDYRRRPGAARPPATARPALRRDVWSCLRTEP